MDIETCSRDSGFSDIEKKSNTPEADSSDEMETRRKAKTVGRKPSVAKSAKKLTKAEREERKAQKLKEQEDKALKKEMLQREKEEKRREKEAQVLLKQQEKEARALKKQLEEEDKQRRVAEKELRKEQKVEEQIRAAEEKQNEKQRKIDEKELLRKQKIEEQIRNAKMKEEEKIKRKEEKKRMEEEQKSARKEKALKGMKYLLGISEKYSNFFVNTTQSVNKKDVLKEKNKYQPTIDDLQVASMNEDLKVEDKSTETLNAKEDLKLFNGKLRPYQIEGVTWMTTLYHNGLNGILADEMGLGKTVQIIALIAYQLQRGVAGPYMIVAPLSTIPNWISEFERFAPQIPVVVFPGEAGVRERAKPKIAATYKVGGHTTRPVVITNFGVPLRETSFLDKFVWQYIIIDEGHRIKNHESKLSVILRNLNSTNRLLLTGTPLQNNITELWALLNFVLPHIFNKLDTFETLFEIETVQDKNKILESEEKDNIVSTIHKVLGPFMLRRLKSEVLDDMVPKKEVVISCPMSKMQKDLYKYVLDHNIAKLKGDAEEEEEVDLYAPRKKRKCTENRRYFRDNENEDDLSDYEQHMEEMEKIRIGNLPKKEKKEFIHRVTMSNSVVMYKKIVDHPYLVHFPLDPNSTEKKLLVDENLINHSGKMIVLQTMLKKLKEKGHKVLLFSTLVMMLDIIEELMIMRGIKYQRLDGSYSLQERQECIDKFNNDPDCFVFLISTRSGGLGLNLTSADTVIFFDRDWNPQADIQAQDRCHRIGQTRPVVVYTLVLRNTIDEQIIASGNMKRRLEKIVIRDGKFKTLDSNERNKTENDLLELKKLLMDEENAQSIDEFSDAHLDKLLDRSDLYEMMRAKEKKDKENLPRTKK